jgi:AraC family transcriptional regulator
VLQAYRETRRRFFDHATLRVECAAARAARNCRTPEALTSELQIVLTLRGAFVYELGSSRSLLTANHALFIAPGDVSRDRFVDDQPLDYMLVTPRGEMAAALVETVRETRVAHASAQLQRAASALWNLCVREPLRDDIEVEQCALELFASIAPPSCAVRTRPSQLIGAAKELIGTAREPRSLISIAAELDVSPAYLTDQFRRHEGVSIARYERRLRLSRALIELPHTEDIAALALELGFSSHAHFSTAFRATYGEAPSTYRHRIRRSSAPKESESAGCDTQSE